VVSLVIAATAGLPTGGFDVLGRHAALCAGFTGLVLLSSAAAPAYMRWHAHMRRPGADERKLVVPHSTVERTRRTIAARARHQRRRLMIAGGCRRELTVRPTFRRACCTRACFSQ
jgi:hypothetical protein